MVSKFSAEVALHERKPHEEERGNGDDGIEQALRESVAAEAIRDEEGLDQVEA